MLSAIHVVPRIMAEASGPSYSVQRLASALVAARVDVELHVLQPLPETPLFPKVVAYPALPGFWRIGFSPRMQRALREKATKVDIVHNHSLWMMPNIYPLAAARKGQCRLVVSPRGTLSAWAMRRRRGLKTAMWVLGQGAVLRNADCIHATAVHEWHDVRRLGLRAPVAVIPHGIDVPECPLNNRKLAKTRRLLFLGRVHPVKGVDALLKAWRVVEPEFPGWELIVAGPDNVGYLREMQKLADGFSLRRVSFVGGVYGEKKNQLYQSADLYVLPTHSENFGLTIAEALANRVPVVTTKGAPWSGLETHGCGWWLDIGIEPLVECLRGAMALTPGELQVLGMAGREWMLRDFSWERVGQMMAETYRWLVDGGTKPVWVMLD